MKKILYFYIKDGRIEVTEYPRPEPPDKVIEVTNENESPCIKISFN